MDHVIPRDSLLRATVTRRRFGRLAGGMLATAFLACRGSAARLSSDGRIAARPRNGGMTTASGTRPLGIGGERGAFLQVPSKASPAPLPLLVLLHGASGGRAAAS